MKATSSYPIRLRKLTYRTIRFSDWRNGVQVVPALADWPLRYERLETEPAIKRLVKKLKGKR